MKIRKLFLTLTTAIFALAVYGEDRSVLLTYPTGYIAPDLSEKSNVNSLNELARLIKEAKSENRGYKLICTSYSSPENDNQITRNIGKSREESLLELFEERGLATKANMEFVFGGTGWSILQKQVENSNPAYKNEILSILATPDQVVMSNVYDNQAMITEGLKKINDGKVWHEIRYTVFPVIRNTLYLKTSGGEKLRVRYRIGMTDPDMDNPNTNEAIRRAADALKNGQTVEIAYSPNPGGDNEIYRNIAEARAKDLVKVLTEECGANPGKISYTTSNDGWYDLKSIISHSNEPWSREALEVIENYRGHLLKSSKTADNVKVKLLKGLDNGKVYHELETEMFPVINNILSVRFLSE